MENINVIIKNLLRHDYEGVKKLEIIEGIPEIVEVDPWECSLGNRAEHLALLGYSKTEGFSSILLPTQRQLVSAIDGYGLVPYFTSDFAKNLKGTYVLIKTLSPGSWEIKDGESTYDEYVTAWIFQL